MSGIDRVGTGPTTLPNSGDPLGGTGKSGAGITQVDSGKLLSDLLKALEVTSGAGAKGSVDGRPGPAGAPALETANGQFDSDELALILGHMQSKATEGQLRTAKEGIELTQMKQKEAGLKAIQKIEEAAAKFAEAKAKEKSAGIFGWIGKIAAFVAAVVATVVAVVATVATAGAAAPLLAIAVMGLVATGMDLANHISQNMDPPGPEISAGKLMMKGAEAVLKGFGMSEDEAKKWAPVLVVCAAPGISAIMAPEVFGEAAMNIAVELGMKKEDAQWLAMAVTLAVTIATAVVIIVASGGMGALDGAARVAQNIGRITQGVSAVVTGATGIAQGAIKIDAAASVRDAEMAQADKKKIDAAMVKLAQAMEEDQDKVKELIENLDAAMTMVSQMLASASQTRVATARNIV